MLALCSATKERKKLSLPAKASFFSIGTNVISKGISIIFTSVFTRILLPSEFGEYTAFASWVGIASAISTFELCGSVLYRGMQRWREEYESFLSSALGLLSVFLLSAVALYLPFRQAINSLTGLSTATSLLVFLDIFFNSAINFFSARCRYFYRHRALFIINLSYSFLFQVGALILIKMVRIGGEGRIYASVGTAVLLGLPLFIYIFLRGKRFYSKKVWKFLFLFNLPLFPQHLARTVSTHADRVIIERFFDEGVLAKYSVALSAGLILSLLVSGLNSALTPWVFRKVGAGRIDAVRQVGANAARLLSISTLMLLSIAPEALSLLAPKEYRDALFVVYPAAASVMPSFITTLISSAKMQKERNFSGMAATVISAIATLTLNALLLPRVGYTFASVNLLISALLTLLLLYLFCGKEGRAAVNTRSLLSTHVFLLGGAMLLYFLKEVPPVRVLVLILLTLLFFLEAIGAKEILIDK